MARSRTRAPLSTTTTVTKTQTVRINGARVKISTKSGNVTTKPALPLEWELQAAQVSALRRLPQYQRQFLLSISCQVWLCFASIPAPSCELSYGDAEAILAAAEDAAGGMKRRRLA